VRCLRLARNVRGGVMPSSTGCVGEATGDGEPSSSVPKPCEGTRTEVGVAVTAWVGLSGWLNW
jgi:hypothetical protein